MSPLTLLMVLLAMSAVAWHLARRRALGVGRAAGGLSALHSLPAYYGTYAALWCGIPALALYALWLAFEPTLITAIVVQELPGAYTADAQRLALIVNDIRNTVSGNITSETNPDIAAAARRYAGLQTYSLVTLTLLALAVAIGGASYAYRAITPQLRARNNVERVMRAFLILSSTVAVFTTVGIVFSVLFESLRFFSKVPVTEFVFGLQWSPQTAIRADQVGSSGAFGAIPLLVGTLLISFIAMSVATPIGLFSAIYLAEYAGPRLRTVAKPTIEILAGIPTVVYGFFAALTVAPFLRNEFAAILDCLIALPFAVVLTAFAALKRPRFLQPWLRYGWEIAGALAWLVLTGLLKLLFWAFPSVDLFSPGRVFVKAFGIEVSSESALAAGVVMGLMLIPFISSLSDDVINAVPQSLRDGSYGLGATRSETIRQVILPAALPGIVGGLLLAVSRAIGETMIVVMAAGLAANLTLNPLDAVTTVTVQIVTLLVGDQEFDSAKTLAAFALGLTLFVVTLALNFIALDIVKRYREQYD